MNSSRNPAVLDGANGSCNVSTQDDTTPSTAALSPNSPASPEIVDECTSLNTEGTSLNDEGEHLDAEQRLARSRDRNREHARRTRLRKKQQLEALQKRVKELQEESKLLKQTIEECSIASILLGLSSGDSTDTDDDLDLKGIESVISTAAKEKTFFTVTGKRKRFVSDADINPAPMKLKIRGKTTLVGGPSNKAQINWKTGVYLDDSGEQQQLTPKELEALRRERNRMHAKMTRDRKKLFINSVEKTISDLEENNKRMRQILAKQALRHSPCVTPDFAPVEGNPDNVPSITIEALTPKKLSE